MSANRRAADEGIAESVAKLARILLPDQSVPEVLATVTSLACQTVEGCEGASVSLVSGDSGDGITTAAPTDEWAQALDDAQYSVDEGPCLHAVRTGAIVQVDDFTTDTRWPLFAPLALQKQLVSSLSMPLAVASERIGGLNLYSRTPRGYSEASVVAAQRLAVQAAVVLANAQAYERSLRLVDQLQAAMLSRAEIEQAKGIIMAESHVDADRAFDVLRRASQRKNVKLRVIAHQIVDNAINPPNRRGGGRAPR
jgi:GAF domain-containing protein